MIVFESRSLWLQPAYILPSDCCSRRLHYSQWIMPPIVLSFFCSALILFSIRSRLSCVCYDRILNIERLIELSNLRASYSRLARPYPPKISSSSFIHLKSLQLQNGHSWLWLFAAKPVHASQIELVNLRSPANSRLQKLWHRKKYSSRLHTSTTLLKRTCLLWLDVSWDA